MSFLLAFFFLPSAFAGGDIVLESLYSSQNVVAPHSGFKVYVKLKNPSSADMTGIVKFYDETTQKNVSQDTSFTLIAGGETTLFTQIKLIKLGEHNLAARVVPFDESGDSVDNNKKYFILTVESDFDKDGVPDSLDTDIDGDGVVNEYDVFPRNKSEWYDTDSDGIGNNADTDDDNDGVSDVKDAFPTNANETLDTDGDGIGNNEDMDDDNDGIDDEKEILTDPLVADTDGDGVIDGEDLFPLDDKRMRDTDNDGISNFEDFDDDNDGVRDYEDAFPLDDTEWLDTDGDGIGNNADLDDDNDELSDEYEINTLKTHPLYADTDKDGFIDSHDAFPLDSDEWKDSDEDGIGDNEDVDDDNDNIIDEFDLFPFNQKENRDFDGDGIGDNEDTDDDNDGVNDREDVFPFDPTEWSDADGDNLGDNADPNDNNKGPIIVIDVPEKIMIDEPVLFSSLDSEDPDGNIAKVEWYINDILIFTGGVFENVFTQSEKTTLRVRVFDNSDEYREKTFDIHVEKNMASSILLIVLAALCFILFFIYKMLKDDPKVLFSQKNIR
ncbi:hypothetical protein COB57_04805 [Candidatus Peregrinibacteria bacterium]|nr:MAG: hypothetical protein COB57_04805 [Candidatus Peregrinibacteria bacterium]